MLPFPNISPIAFEVGPLAVRWYALAYIAGVVLGWRGALYLARRSPHAPAPQKIDDVISWLILGILLGGRLGYVLFYNLDHYIKNPFDALMIWHGGMAFHGGLLGVIIAAALFCWKNKIAFLSLTDLLAPVAPIGLFFGRIANFINGELYGRITDVPWGMVFPHGGDVPRHPSPLYQAGLEGLLLFIILFTLAHNKNLLARRGFLSGLFLVLYGIVRCVGELFREPDAHIGFLLAGTTMGQLLSIPMIIIGATLLMRSRTS